MGKRLAPFIAVLFAVLISAASVVKLPYFWEGPGPVHDVVPLIRVSGEQTYPTDDRLLLTTVSISSDRITALQLINVWLDPHKDLVAQSAILSPGETIQHQNRLETYAMDESQLAATYVVLSSVGGYPAEHASGALVESTREGCDAYGKLFGGNVITAINGEPIADSKEASKVIDTAAPGQPITFTARAGKREVEIDLTRKPCGPNREDLVGVGLVNNFPFRVDISAAGIGGPSAGLMFSLGLYDKLTPGDLTGGRVVAGTGGLFLDGTVYPIGGVEKKVYAAAEAGATVFLLPKENYAAARAAGADIRLVPISSFDEALAALTGDTGTQTAKGT